MTRVLWVSLCFLLLGAQCGESGDKVDNDAGSHTLSLTVVKRFPHDTKAFTQGLVVKDGYFYESTGQYGQSSLRKVAMETGDIVKKYDLAPEYFAEGLAAVGDQWVQLTWQNRVGFTYSEDGNGFTPDAKTFPMATEGWGLAFRPGQLLLSDGSDTLYDLDLQSKEVKNKITVKDAAGPVRNLNELEFVENWLLANVWQSNDILVINPETGLVKAKIEVDPKLVLDAQEAAALQPGQDVLNGIAYDSANKRLFITGKNWPRMVEISVPRLATLTP